MYNKAKVVVAITDNKNCKNTRMRTYLHLVILVFLLPKSVSGQTYLSERAFQERLVKDEITRAYLMPVDILWLSDDQGKQVRTRRYC